MKGIGFIPDLWVNKAREAGIFPTLRSFLAASIIARAADLDGRWCYLYQESMVGLAGGLFGLSSVKRGIDDLIGAGILRRLTPEQTRVFFVEGLAIGKRSFDALPLVLELMIPAEDFPDPVREEINAVRAGLGEELLDETTRPRLRKAAKPPKAATVQSESGGSSDRPTNLFPNHLSPNEPPGSVRGSSTTGEETGRKPTDGPHGRIARIPDCLLFDPVADRAALGRAVDALARQGLDTKALTALFRGMEHLDRPYPALMSRLRDLDAARAFLNGGLGRGVSPLGQPLVPRPRAAGDDDLDAFARVPEFDVDARGTATRTCPDHPGVRNVPGGTCQACGKPCRSVPDELLHPPAPSQPPSSGGGGECPDVEEPPGEEVPDLDPVLTQRVLASLMAGGSTADAPVGEAPSAHPPARQAIIDGIRQRLTA
ncbi:hypothetical protein [Nocardiopsis halotolerans]|uniref:hypothetical protein n=1 Tax=Nocardiopsis halotolerans TaxID=124252 RepID=UPI000346C46E|nr:hypothetical protein [Nocardiopsis halotolerans]